MASKPRAEEMTLPTKCEPSDPCDQSGIRMSIPLGTSHNQMASVEGILNAEIVAFKNRRRELQFQMDQEKAARAKAEVEVEAE
jgi:hypothetical protein